MVKWNGWQVISGTWDLDATPAPSHDDASPGIILANYSYPSPTMRVELNLLGGTEENNSLPFPSGKWIGVVVAFDETDGSYLLARIRGISAGMFEQWRYGVDIELWQVTGSGSTLLASEPLVPRADATYPLDRNISEIAVCYDRDTEQFTAVLPPGSVYVYHASYTNPVPDPWQITANNVVATGNRAGVYAQGEAYPSTLELLRPLEKCDWCRCQACERNATAESHTVEFAGIVSKSHTGVQWDACPTLCTDINALTFVIDHERHNAPCEFLIYPHEIYYPLEWYQVACVYIIKVWYKVEDGQRYRVIDVLAPDYENGAIFNPSLHELYYQWGNNGWSFLVEARAIDPIDDCSSPSTDVPLTMVQPSGYDAMCDWSSATVSVGVTMP